MRKNLKPEDLGDLLDGARSSRLTASMSPLCWRHFDTRWINSTCRAETRHAATFARR